MVSPDGTSRIVQVYRSSKRVDTYLYAAASTSIDRLPQALLESFGTPVPVLRLWLTPEKRLARISGSELLAALDDKGFYLQLADPANGTDNQLAELAARVTESCHQGGAS